MRCGDCKFYQKGLDGKQGECGFAPPSDMWNDVRPMPRWIGYSDEKMDRDSLIYVDEDFGCVNFKNSK